MIPATWPENRAADSLTESEVVMLIAGEDAIEKFGRRIRGDAHEWQDGGIADENVQPAPMRRRLFGEAFDIVELV